MVKGIIVLEGADGTGKTTLAEVLCRRYNGHYIHLTYKPNIYPYQTEELVKAVQVADDQLVVIDRHWISEQIYARVYRNGSDMAHCARGMDRVLRKHGAVYILCVPDTIHEVAQSYEQLRQVRQEMYDHGMADVAVRYLQLVVGSPKFYYHNALDYCEQLTNFEGGMCSRPDTIRYRRAVEGQNLPEFVRYVIAKLLANRTTQYQPALSSYCYNVLGHLLQAKYLIVGDSPGHPDLSSPPSLWPFYKNQYSSEFLYEAFYYANIDETQFMWTNANVSDGRDHIKELVYTYGLTPICLGNNAVDRVRRITDRYVSLSHPQYAKRFLGKEAKKIYTNQLLCAIKKAKELRSL